MMIPNDFFSQSIDGTHFTWDEALSQGNTGVWARPTPQQVSNIVRQAHLLEQVRNVLGPLVVTSWLRTVQHNKDVGGASNSTHLVGAATDFIPVKTLIEDAKRIIQDQKLYPGGGEINTTTWVHLDFIHQSWFMA